MSFALNDGRRLPLDPNQISVSKLAHTTVHVSVIPNMLLEFVTMFDHLDLV